MKGLSYQNGVLFLGKEYIGWAQWKQKRPEAEVLPINTTAILKIGKHVFQAMPLWYKITSGILGIMLFLPKILGLFSEVMMPEFPLYTLFYFLFGTHFIFPKELRKFHGAEHKVFSYKGVKKRRNIYRMKRASITNRYCSTNVVVLYFLLIALGWPLLTIWHPWETALALISYAAVPLALLLHRGLQKKKMYRIRQPLLYISYYVQRHISCASPERRHMLTAMEAYRALAKQEYPHLLSEKKSVHSKEAKNMAIIDITVVPVGTESTSISEDVAQIQEVLKKHTEKIDYQLTSMGTIIEGHLSDIFPIVQELHEIPFERGAKRVSTNIRIDDRRDKDGGGMTEKLKSVEDKLN
ncbi:thiamine-binding protein [Salibacterium salarium]|uniref:Thiamine-binding protein n=1 Tax=Salibacterium salarium TaxID=284579 RepID=A0A428MY25_9BACI|nr:MTH1187 family thiamine-binding protein [Salibacterium salarium]RSL30939.1 thiamine-binding protein [Salibacterium salarium]